MRTFTPDGVLVAVTRSDGGVSLMRFMVLARGGILPDGASWVDQSIGAWARDPTAENIEREVRKQWGAEAVSWRIVDAAEVPADREFRNAVRDDGKKLHHDIGHARGIVRDRIREKRARELAALDAQWMRATGQGKKADVDKIEAERQKWRDAPADPRIDAAQTVEELKTLLPGG